jgi:hypothetical protein
MCGRTGRRIRTHGRRDGRIGAFAAPARSKALTPRSSSSCNDCAEENPAARFLERHLFGRRQGRDLAIAFSHGRRRLGAGLFLDLGDERTQRGRRAPPAHGRQRQARVHLGETLVTGDVLAPADDAIGKRNARRAAGKLAHLEARAALAAHVEPATIAARREEDVIVAALDHLGEVGIELDGRAPARELARAEILEPMLRALHAMQHALRSVGKLTAAFFTPAVSVPVTTTLPAK